MYSISLSMLIYNMLLRAKKGNFNIRKLTLRNMLDIHLIFVFRIDKNHDVTIMMPYFANE